jgi:hypothetical protein
MKWMTLSRTDIMTEVYEHRDDSKYVTRKSLDYFNDYEF